MRFPPTNDLPVSASILLVVGVALSGCGSDGPTGPDTPDPVITTSELPTAFVGELYSAGVDAEGGGGGYSWEVIDGGLPPRLQLSVDDVTDDDLLITGTPAPDADGVYRFTLQLTSADGRSTTSTFTLTVRPPPEPLEVGTAALVPGLAGHPYTVELRALGGRTDTYAWNLIGGELPPGVELSSSGAFQGSPAAPGNYPITLQVVNGEETDTEDFSWQVLPDEVDQFNITPFPVRYVRRALWDNVQEAMRRWESAIVGDLPRWDVAEGVFTSGAAGDSFCGGFGGLADGTSIDDVIMLINISEIDGPGAVLGQAGTCSIRAESGDGKKLPILGVLTLDVEDLLANGDEEAITELIQHEMGHILGLSSTMWNEFELLAGEDTEDPRFLGAQAIAEYQAAGGAGESVPVEGGGGAGTANSHWDEEVFSNELMTGYLNSGGNFLSAMSIASFADLGYEVDVGAAEQPLVALRQPGITAVDRLEGYDVVGVGPITVITRDGRTTSVIEPMR